MQYDLRHSIDSANISNYPSQYFEFFKLVNDGAVFVKTQADFNAKRNNFWNPPVFVHVEYNGGVGVAQGSSFGYSINNAFLLGPQTPFQWGDDWQSVSLCYRYSPFDRPSHDAQLSFYWSKNLPEGRFDFSGSLVLFTENRNHGDPGTAGLSGKKVLFWGQPQIWFNVSRVFSIGSQLTMYYHIYSYSGSVLVYPTIAVKYLL